MEKILPVLSPHVLSSHVGPFLLDYFITLGL